MGSDEVQAAAEERFGWDDLHAGQLEAITAAVNGCDVLAVMPTGYGKSAIYQVAATLIDGPTLIVSPLIALQADQVAGITAAEDAPDAVAVNSAQSARTNADAWEALSTKDAEYLFLAPEQLAKDDVIERLKHLGVSLFVVDEAHCVSSWGHDFRPDYLRLGEVIERLGHPTVVALTATGSPPVREEIVERLGLRDALVLTRGFDRPNLRLEVVRHAEDKEKRRAVVEQVVELPKPGLVYVATRKDTERYAEELAGQGLRVAAYHAGLTASERTVTHEAFHADEVDVVVATSAFGMGIDKPNVRFVVHAAIPESIDAYYQEIGRAGRDDEPATTTLHYRAEDLGLRTFFNSGTPDHGDLARAYRAVAAADAPIRVSAVGAALDVTTRRASNLLNLLEEAGLVDSDRRGVRATASVDPGEAATLATEVAESRERIEQSRIAMMRSYAETSRCRRQFLLGYFGEDLAEPCGNCDTCTSGSAYETDASAPAPSDAAREHGAVGFPPETTVRHREWGPGTVMSVEDDRITVFFEEEGYKVLSLDAIREHDLLDVV
ncbi:RecQ family ATP-dependent DNA helicase [Cryobacterium tepidiphilum]|uniref:ATP-dependent DNA helicase RecQ n=1 Tax=Cryobacterium tepidiphilum TaxID=2486026 RepID=A0A3M8LPJ4_9MICO|nr:RecQ family ATP-dependent DNA helicase [Cryobacterium tepidiphilum]